MGLAASQARLLFITSRQNDVSAKMQRVSNDNMVLARDSDEVSEKYNKMLNATKMQLKDGVELSYDALMGSTAINNRGSMNIITNADGKVVLSTADMSKYGLPSSGEPKDISDKLHLKVTDLVTAGESDPTTRDAIIAALSSTSTDNKTQQTSGTLTDEDKSKIQKFKSAYGEYPATEKVITISDAMNKAGKGNYSSCSTYGSDRWCDIQKEMGSLSMENILKGNYTAQSDKCIRLATEGDRRGVPADMAKKNMQIVCEQFKELIMNGFGFKSGGTVDKKLTEMIDSLVKSAYQWNGGMNNGVDNTNGCKFKDLVYTNATSTGGSSDNDHMWLNIQGLLQQMCDVALRASSEDYNGNMNDTSQMVTIIQNSKGYSKSDYESKLQNYLGGGNEKLQLAINYLAPTSAATGGNTNGTATVAQKAQCYQTLYNSLYNNGWSAENTENIAENLKNGTYKLNGQVLGSNTDLYEEVADKDTQAKAESYWKTEMGKIQRKEKLLDQELTKLQTEYSSLTTDYESVKSIISQNVSRSFTYCQNG